ncbi:MAG: CinA family protein [Thermomicrobiales bacterium]|nr:CinA family protein [Thermomicrobiales bacterium]
MSGPDRQATRPVGRSPEQRLNDLLVGRSDVQIAAAESCTGGEVAHRITAIAGSSDYFQGSLVTYSNLAKTNLLGVQNQILESVGAVSEACARAMAEGARRAYAADIAVSTTGIAGPGGATARKPVGLVYIGLASPAGVTIEQHVFPGDRTAVVDAAAERALELLVAAVERQIAPAGR